MSVDVLITKSELENKPSAATKRKRSIWGIIWRAVMIAVIVISLCTLALLYYVKVNFSEDIYVNGMSMYPTLNSDAKSLVVDGDYVEMFKDADGYDFNKGIKKGDLVDYALSDPRNNTLNKLSRFDIVVTYYESDYRDGKLKDNAVPKIKRLVGLPGETVELGVDDTPMGVLKIDGEVVKQPGNDIERFNAPLKRAGINTSYPLSKDDAASSNWAGKEVVLGDDEYYVLGDNRFGYNSSDSRFVGPIKAEYIHAKFGFVLGVCRIGDDGKTCKLTKYNIRWPSGGSN